MNNRYPSGNKAFTLVEFMVVIAYLAVLALVLVPASIKAKQKAQRISCSSDLKCISFAFRQWADDNTNLYPMQVSTEFGGTKERIAARSFSPGINNANVSYFVALGADETEPQRFLAGDRVIFKGARPANGVVGLTTNNFAGWSTDIHHGSINVALADGSVQGLSSNRLYQMLDNTGLANNWIQLP